jgi:hypothetical protein
MSSRNRSDRIYDQPHFPLSTIVAVAVTRDILITDRAIREAELAFPSDLVDLDEQLREIVASLVPDEFQFAQRKILTGGGVSWVDVYRIDFEGCDVWLKIKLESDKHGEYVAIISCHQWDESIPI